MNRRQGMNLSTRDYEGFRTDMIEMLKKKIPEYSDFSQSDVGIVLIELLAYNLDVLSYYNDKVANELFLETAMERESVIRLCNMIGYTLRESVPSRYEQVFEINPQETPFKIPKGTYLETNDSLAEALVDFETDEDLIIPPMCNGLEKDPQGKYLYTVPVTQGHLISNEIVGSSNGSPNQTFYLSYKPVIINSIELLVNDGNGFEVWTKVDNFIDSDSTSKHFTCKSLEDGNTVIKFGNGVSGKVPIQRIDNIMCSYRVGGGKRGNVGTNTIINIPSKLAEIKRTFNPYDPLIEGKDAEGVEEARIKAPSQLGTKFGVVTLSDFKNLALSTHGVKRANAELDKSFFTPLVKVYYLAEPSVNKRALERQLTDDYGDKKLVGTDVELYEATIRKINVVVYAKPQPLYHTTEVQEQVEVTLKNLLIAGEYDFLKYPEPSDLIVKLLDLECLRSCSVEVSNHEDLKPNEIVELGECTVIVGGR